jgi:cell volume regulation protein A
MKKFTPYLAFLTVAFGLSYLTGTVPFIAGLFEGTEGFYLSLALLFAVGYGLNYFAPHTSIPSFVWAIIFGMALQLPLASLTADKGALLIVIELLAAFILFAGGIEVPVRNFKKYFAPIAALSLFGTIATVALFSFTLVWITGVFGIEVSVLSLILLAAILASIDPTAIIPTLDQLHFRKPFLKDIAISESAVNDVTGTIITLFFLVSVVGINTVGDGLAQLFSQDVLDGFALQVVWGVMVGLIGAWILRTWGESIRDTHWSDPALFFAVPVFCFALGSIVGGSGYLAAFVAGLLFESKTETLRVRKFFEQLVDHFMKPVIFILLGALVPIAMLGEYVGIGVVAALVFMFVIRPIVVFTSLLPWMVQKKSLLNWREALFLSFIRETGAIPAVLILTVVATGIESAEFVFAIGMWVILLTLTIEPPLTPLLARRLEVAK